MLQLPPLHAASVFILSQTLPHIPQLFSSLMSEISQPSAGIMLQSEKNGSHGPSWHIPPTHCPSAFSGSHGVLQLPQCSLDVLVFVSQPFVGSASHAPSPCGQPDSSPTTGTTMSAVGWPPRFISTTTSRSGSGPIWPPAV